MGQCQCQSGFDLVPWLSYIFAHLGRHLVKKLPNLPDLVTWFHLVVVQITIDRIRRLADQAQGLQVRFLSMFCSCSTVEFKLVIQSENMYTNSFCSCSVLLNIKVKHINTGRFGSYSNVELLIHMLRMLRY